jgi:hypothetical protein
MASALPPSWGRFVWTVACVMAATVRMFPSAEPQFRLHRNGHPRHIESASGAGATISYRTNFSRAGRWQYCQRPFDFDTRGAGIWGPFWRPCSAESVGSKLDAMSGLVSASEVSAFEGQVRSTPDERTSSDRVDWSVSCQEPASTHLFDHVADLPFDDLINYPISRRLP